MSKASNRSNSDNSSPKKEPCIRTFSDNPPKGARRRISSIAYEKFKKWLIISYMTRRALLLKKGNSEFPLSNEEIRSIMRRRHPCTTLSKDEIGQLKEYVCERAPSWLVKKLTQVFISLFIYKKATNKATSSQNKNMEKLAKDLFSHFSHFMEASRSLDLAVKGGPEKIAASISIDGGVIQLDDKIQQFLNLILNPNIYKPGFATTAVIDMGMMFDIIERSAIGTKIRDNKNLGGKSIVSEAFGAAALDLVLRLVDIFVLEPDLLLETDIQYLAEGKKFDYLVKLTNRNLNLAVSVVRAMHRPGKVETFDYLSAITILISKLRGIHLAKQNLSCGSIKSGEYYTEEVIFPPKFSDRDDDMSCISDLTSESSFASPHSFDSRPESPMSFASYPELSQSYQESPQSFASRQTEAPKPIMIIQIISESSEITQKLQTVISWLYTLDPSYLDDKGIGSLSEVLIMIVECPHSAIYTEGVSPSILDK